MHNQSYKNRSQSQKQVRRIFLSCVLAFVFFTVEGQGDTLNNSPQKIDYEQIFSTNHWNFLIRPVVHFPGSAHFSNPQLQFDIKPTAGVQFGWMYQFNIKKGWGIQTGLNIELGWQSFKAYMPASYQGFSYNGAYVNDYNVGKYFDLLSYVLPIYAVYRLPINDKKNRFFMDFKLGADVKYGNSFGVDYAETYTDPVLGPEQTFHYSQNEHKFTIYPSIHASAGVNYILPNKKVLNLEVVGNFSPFYADRGTFSFVPGSTKEVSGNYTRHYNYIGFELNYIFTAVRHMDKPHSGYNYETRRQIKDRLAHRYPYDGDTLTLRKRQYTYDQIFSTDHDNFVIQFNCLPGSVRYKNQGLSFIQLSEFGPELGWMYQFNLRKRWGLQIGARMEFESAGYNFDLSRSYTGYSTDIKSSYAHATLASFILPVYVCYYVPFHDKKERWLSNFKLGTDIKYGFSMSTYGSLSFQYKDPVTLRSYTYFTYSESHNGSNIYAALHASWGVNYILPNKRMLNLQIIGGWSPLYRNNITYSFLPGTLKEVDGLFSRDYSYLAFQINYIFTNPYRMKKGK
jgi:hypothetical protein